MYLVCGRSCAQLVVWFGWHLATLERGICELHDRMNSIRLEFSGGIQQTRARPISRSANPNCAVKVYGGDPAPALGSG